MDIVAIYGRVSTQEQAREGYSLCEQESRLRLYAEAHGWTVGACYMDAGKSGKDMDRPGLQALIRDAEAHRVSKILVYKLDRLSRRQRDTLYLIEDIFLKNKVDFVSLTETLDTSTPLGIAMIGILSVFAQLERENIKERMIVGRDARVKSGRYRNSGGVPVGYRRIGNRMEIDPYEAAIVRDCFRRYIEGDTVTAMAREFNMVHLRGRTWVASHITMMLTNTVYAGRQRWKGELYDITEGLEPLIDQGTFETVQRELARRSVKRDKPLAPQRHTTLLGGMIWCGDCGSRFYGSSRKVNGVTIHRYFCYGRTMSHHRGMGKVECRCKSRDSKVVNAMVVSEIRKLSLDRSALDRLQVVDTTAAKRSAIETRLREIDKQIDRLIDLYALDTLDLESLSRRSAALKAESAELRSQLDALTPTGRQSRKDIESTLDDFDAALAVAPPDYMNLYDIVRKLLKSVTINPDGIALEWNI